MAFEQAGYQAAGKKLELIEEDNEGNPGHRAGEVPQAGEPGQDPRARRHPALQHRLRARAADRARPPAVALPHDARRPHEAPARASTSSASNFAASQPMHALGDYAAKTLKYKRVVAIAMDNPFGHEGIGGFQKRVRGQRRQGRARRSGCRSTRWTSRRSCRQVPRDVDAVVQVFVAGQAVRFAKHYGDSPLHGKVPLIGSGVFSDQSSLVGMGDEAIGARRRGDLGADARQPGQPHVHAAGGGEAEAPAVLLPRGDVQRRPVDHRGGEGRSTATSRIATSCSRPSARRSETTPDPRGPIKLDEYGNPTREHLHRQGREGGRQAAEHGRSTPIRWCRSSGRTSRTSSSRRRPTTATIRR